MSDNEIRLVVFGGTGEGKTSFVVSATGAPLEIGDDADSCTQEVQTGSVTVGSKTVTIIDTPGFDDTEGKDMKIFEKLTDWLEKLRAQGKYLNGVILVQSVNHARAPDSERKRTRLLKKIIGEPFYNRVAIVTTMWDVTRPSVCERGEQNRGSRDIWGDMLAAGAKVFRFQNDKQSALEVICHYTENPSFAVPAPTLLQDELVANNGVVKNTSAAAQFKADVAGKAQELEDTLGNMEDNDEVKEVRDYIETSRNWLEVLAVIVVPILGKVVIEAAKSCAIM
ncbi:P-loop containing nucleoside triphosphate hydrolase protein [Xylaria digitata]|nr:P-loop containing nucleoside triphosphate hydrolase protein [Xylaria digitata]